MVTFVASILVKFETVECNSKRSRQGFVPHWTARSQYFSIATLDWLIFAQRPFKRLLMSTELSFTFLDGETSVVVKNVGIPSGTILAIDHDVTLNVVSVVFFDSEAVESAWVPCDISG